MRTSGQLSRRPRLSRAAALALLLVVAALVGLDLTLDGEPRLDRSHGGGPGARSSESDPVRSRASEPGARASESGPRSRASESGPRSRGSESGPRSRGAEPRPEGSSSPGPGTPSYPVDGPGTFQDAPGAGPVQGAAGVLRRYRVAVENGSGVTAADFAAAVDGTLGDERSWIASGRLRVQRVPADGTADFTVVLATPVTSERLCAEGGLVTERYTSCRLPGKVVINLARWMEAVPDYAAPLATYRTYVINHEVGHELGEGHEDCPGPGQPAPVMQQQTYGLRGCVAYAWPYLDGARYAGPIVP